MHYFKQSLCNSLDNFFGNFGNCRSTHSNKQTVKNKPSGMSKMSCVGTSLQLHRGETFSEKNGVHVFSQDTHGHNCT